MGWDAGELVTIRKDKQFSELFLTFIKPIAVYTARLNGAPSSNDKIAQITYNSGSGTLSNVKVGMTIRFGTTAGAKDLGEERIRKTPSATVFYIGETSEIDFVNNSTCYITVVDDFQIREKHIRIDGGNVYADYDVAFSDQFTNFDPVPVFGGHRIAWIKPGASNVVLQYDLTKSWVIGSTISAYLTECAGATVSNATTNSPSITISAPGKYLVYVTLTAANGKSFTGVRYIYVHSDTDLPLQEFELNSLSGSYENGGFSSEITLFDNDETTVEAGAIGILHAKDYYDGVQVENLETLSGHGNILMSGRIKDESLDMNGEQNKVSLELIGFQESGKSTAEQVALSGMFLDEQGVADAYFSISQGRATRNYFPFGLEFSATPGNWVSINSLTVKKALYVLLHWFSTVTKVMDVMIENDSRLVSELLAPSQNIWDKIIELSQQTVFMNAGVDQFGRLIIETEPQLVPEASRNPDLIMAITSDDWQEHIEFDRKVGNTGSPEVHDRLSLSSQSQSNQLAGLLHGWRNNKMPNMQISFARNNRGFTLFPRQIASINIQVTDNARGIAYNGNIIPREVNYEYDAENGFLFPSITFETETFESINANGDIPGSEGLEKFPDLPTFPISLPSSPVILPSEAVSGDVKRVLLYEPTIGLVYSNNFDTENPTWQTINNGLTTAQFRGINIVIIDNNGGIYVAKRYLDWSGNHTNPFIAYATAPGATFTIIEDVASITAKHGGTAQFVSAIGINKETGLIMYIIGSNAGDTVVYTGKGTEFSEGVTISNHHTGTLCTGSLSFGDGSWIHTGWGNNFWQTTRWWKISENGNSIEDSETLPEAYMGYHTRAGNSGKLFHTGRFNNYLTYSINNCETFVDITNAEFSNSGQYEINLISSDSSGNYIMLRRTNAGRRGRSSDGGAVITGMGNLPYSNAYCFEYCKGEGLNSHWIAAQGMIKYSKDFGATWHNKEGNIATLILTPVIGIIKYMG
jgi:hypothetical protein